MAPTAVKALNSAAHYDRVLSDAQMRFITLFVKNVATRPLNEEQFSRLKMDLVGNTSLSMTEVRKVIAACHEDGRYDDTLCVEVDTKIQGSVMRNRRDIGLVS